MTNMYRRFNTTTGKEEAAPISPPFNGLSDPTKFNISYNVALNRLTVTYASGAEVWVNDTRFVKSGTESVSHTGITGKWFFYYNASGTLVASQTDWDILTAAPLARMYLNGTSYIITDERHPAFSGMSNATHKNLHLTRGTQTVSGFAISGYTLATANNVAALTYGVASGVIADEDLFHNVNELVDGVAYRVAWRSGASGAWTWVDSSTTGIWSNAGTNIAYNQFTGGSWGLTDVGTNNRWINYFVVAFPELTQTKQIMVIMGQTLHTSLASAQSEDPTTSLAGLTDLSDEMVVLYRMTYQRIASTPLNAELVSVQAIRTNTISVTGGFAASDHSSLSGRSATNSHPATAISLDTTTFDNILSGTETDVQTALSKIDNVNAQVINTTYTPSFYTPAAVGSESTVMVSAHLKGIDTAMGGKNLTSSVSVSVGQIVTYEGTTANLAIADGSVSDLGNRQIGIAVTSGTNFQVATKQGTTVAGYTGLTRGPVYVSTSVAGNITNVATSVSSAQVYRVGYAEDANTVRFDPEYYYANP